MHIINPFKYPARFRLRDSNFQDIAEYKKYKVSAVYTPKSTAKTAILALFYNPTTYKISLVVQEEVKYTANDDEIVDMFHADIAAPRADPTVLR